ncbi:MAG: EAL domain-containing protein [Candidatus Thiodiazotropha sp. (ex Lucinoma borealis)]|nr:EAL domain-containing protein [Candidatus Thiodiazotropha sp. (ex Lucinoma borealis)]
MTTKSLATTYIRLAIPWVCGLFFFVLLIYLWRVDTILDQLRLRESLHVDLSSETLTRIFSEPISDTLILSQSSGFSKWTKGTDNTHFEKELTQNFLSFSRFKNHYDQIRFLDHTGMERIRINIQSGEPQVASSSTLQNKSSRYYFYEAQLLNFNEVYISPLDLNKEHGEIEQPFKPTIRLATPVFNTDNERIGVLVINYQAEPMLQRYAALHVDTESKLMLLNSDGYWLYHPDQEKRWGFMFENNLTLANELPDEWHEIQKNNFKQWETANGLFTALSTLPFKEAITWGTLTDQTQIITTKGYPWIIVSQINPNALQAVKSRITQNLTIVTAPLLLLLLIFLYMIVYQRVQRTHQQALNADNESRTRSILESIADGIVTVTTEGRILDANPAAEIILGLSEQQLQSRSFIDLPVSDQDRDALQNHLNQTLQTHMEKGINKPYEFLASRGDNTQFPLQIFISPVFLDEQQSNTVSLRDVSEQRRTEQELILAGEVFETATEGIVVTDSDMIIQRVNPAYCKLTGYLHDELIGQKPSLLRSQKTDISVYHLMWQKINDTDRWEGEITNRLKDGENRVFYLSIFAIRDDSGIVVNFASVSRDITAEKESEERIRQHAYYDGLTGLPNRTLFLERLQQAANRGGRYNERFALFFIDLDRFKSVNDSLGHDAGDLLLQLVSGRVVDIIRETDTLARHAGDEFSLLLHNINRDDDLSVLAQKIIKILEKPFDIMGREVHIGASIGIAEFPEDGKEADTLLRNADLAMYEAKHSGKNTYRFFSEELNATIEQHVRLEADLRRAIEEEQLELYYQPLVDYRQCAVVGAEALIRWNHPTRGMISPGEFIPLSEETGLIRPLSEWVIRKGVEQLSSWRSTTLTSLNLSVNLSAYRNRHAVDKDFIKQLLVESDIPPHKLIFEITESLIMENTAESLAWLLFMKNLGIRVAIDDFGTGYSSLSYLKRFPVDILKIDRTFIADMTVNSEDKALVLAIIAMAKSLNLKVVAEGVEKQQQLDLLKISQDHCNVIQGFLFSPAIPASEFATFVADFEYNRYYDESCSPFHKQLQN